VPQQPGCAAYTMPSKVINALAVGGVIVAGSSQPSALWRLSGETEAVRCVDAGDVRAMACAVAELAGDRGRLARLSVAAAVFAAAHFDRDTILSEMLGSAAPAGDGARSGSAPR
jgi:glycosyltransferase involved in cell wall biosynthesis